MLYEILKHWIEQFDALNLINYITFRSFCGFFTAFFLTIYYMPKFIKLLNTHCHFQPIRDDGPTTHLKKKGTPTMGGAVIVGSILISNLLWADLHNSFIWTLIFVMTSLACLGAIDDYAKVVQKNTRGIRGRTKLLIQTLVAIISWIIIKHEFSSNITTILYFPFLKNLTLDLGDFYLLFAAFVIIGSSNAVNLTDGLDGLAIVPIAVVAACFALVTYLVGNRIFSGYLQIAHIENCSEVAVFCAAMIGASLGFLWYNCSPAQIFMGDTGSLALGGVLGTIGVMAKQEFLLAIIGAVFVIEALSVIIQVYYFKITGGKRVFLMAPIHHHFEKKGWPESKVVVRCWIISIILAILGLITLKVR